MADILNLAADKGLRVALEPTPFGPEVFNYPIKTEGSRELAVLCDHRLPSVIVFLDLPRRLTRLENLLAVVQRGEIIDAFKFADPIRPHPRPRPPQSRY